jgi:DNA-directed RNA polymerase subunit RPC12/RpoP
MNVLDVDVRYKEYLEHFSEEVSEEIKTYAIEEAFKFSRYIFTRKDKKQQYGFCTYCETEFKTDGLKHNEETICPKCRSKVMVRSGGMGRKYMIDNVYFVYYEKSIKDPNVLVARGIQAQRDYRFDYHRVKTHYFLRAMYIYDSVKGESTMLEHSFYGNDFEKKSSVFSLAGPYEQRGCRTCYSRGSIESSVKDTPFKYSTWDSYYCADMVKFFELYTKYPNIEYLTKEGCKGLVQDKLDNFPTHRSINWKGKSIFKILKIDKQELTLIKAKKINLAFSFLKVFHDAKKHNWNLTIEETISIAENYLHCYDSLLNALKYSSMRKLLKYFSKQFLDHNRDEKEIHYYDRSSVLTAFRDYLRDCTLLEMDTSRDQVIFPKNLYIAHQNTIKQIKMQKNEKLDVLIKNRVKLLEKYIFECNGLIIRPAESSSELIKEGVALSHCVGGYADRHAKGETNIFLIRKTSEPDNPYYTMEIKKNIIVQVRGKNNRSAGDDVSEFIEVFTSKKLNKQIKKSIVRISA